MRIVLIRGIFKNRFILDHVRNSRPDREHRRNREQDESYHVDDLSRGAGKIDRKEEKKYAAVLESRLIFSQLFRRKHDSRAGRDLTERADDEFPCENNADANRCGDINPVSPKPKNAVFGQHKDKSGVGLAKGYLNDKEKTDASFITLSNGKRIYKTGDMGRYDRNDEIEFLGRLDTQVKIRGHRIELGEIESCFNSCDGVNNAVSVLVKHDMTIKQVLFVTTDGNTDEDILRKYAADNIPAYMMPDKFSFIDEMPLTANGKINKHKLKELAEKIISESTSDADEVDMQMTPTEVKVAEVVKQTLGVDSVDPNVNLYSYGANSLVMAQLAGELASMLEDESAFDNILMNLFENPTVRSTAAAIDSINNGNQ